MKQFLNTNFKYILFVVVGLFVMYFMVYLFTPKPEMSELDKYKLEQLDKDIDSILKKQQLLDKRILEYKTELNKIDSTIAQVRNQKTIIKEYYKEKGEKISGMKPSEIDSLFHKRYNY
jgi:F0F1-type ATP synthase membrane subunit b/b'